MACKVKDFGAFQKRNLLGGGEAQAGLPSSKLPGQGDR